MRSKVQKDNRAAREQGSELKVQCAGKVKYVRNEHGGFPPIKQVSCRVCGGGGDKCTQPKVLHARDWNAMRDCKLWGGNKFHLKRGRFGKSGY